MTAPPLAALVLLASTFTTMLPIQHDDAFEQARGMRRAGQPAEAAQLLRTQHQAHPQDGDTLGLLGLCLLDAGARAEAQELLRAQGPQASASFRLEILRGRVAELANDLDAADAAYREATTLNARAMEAWVLRVRANMTGNRLGKALKLAQQLEALSPDLGRPLCAEVLRKQGDSYRRLGVSTIELAADKYVAALEKSPEDDSLAELVLETQLNAVRTEALAELVAARFQDEPHALQRFYWTGRRLAAEQDANGARAAFEAALAVDPHHAESALWLARLALDDGELDSARAWLQRCSTAGLASAQTELLMGEVLTGLGELATAEIHLRNAAERDPDLTKALYLLGRLLMRTGQTEEARTVLARFQELTRPSAPQENDH